MPQALNSQKTVLAYALTSFGDAIREDAPSDGEGAAAAPSATMIPLTIVTVIADTTNDNADNDTNTNTDTNTLKLVLILGHRRPRLARRLADAGRGD